MIGFVRGKVFSREVDSIIVDCNNIGFKIYFSHPERIRINEEVFIYTYQSVREDDISLFGFLDVEEKNLFTKLINVKGVGTKSAMNILSKANYKDIIVSIENSDIAFFKSLNGVGSKTASQIILDLKGKLVSSEQNEESDELKDAIEALKNLGYKQKDINNIYSILSKENLSSNDYLKLALKLLMKNKME